MPIDLKQNTFKYKDPTTGEYKSVDTLGEMMTFDAEAYTKGTKQGVPVSSGEHGYQDNALYYKELTRAMYESIPQDYTELTQEVANLKDDLEDIIGGEEQQEITGWTHEKYINVATPNIGDTVDITNISSFYSLKYVIVNCEEGDKFLLNLVGAGSARAWAFLTSSNVLISRADASVTLTDVTITAPQNAGKAIFQCIYRQSPDDTTTDEGTANKIVEGSGNAVRFDIAQDKTEAEKAQARENIGIDSLEGAYISYDTEQDLTDEEVTQAQKNIGLIETVTEKEDLYTTIPTKFQIFFTSSDIDANDEFLYHIKFPNRGVGYIGLYNSQDTILVAYGKVEMDSTDINYDGKFKVPSGFSYAKWVINIENAQEFTLSKYIGESDVPVYNKNSVRYDIEQELTDSQKAIARANIGALSSTSQSIVDYNKDKVDNIKTAQFRISNQSVYPLTLVHFSDIHGQSEELARMLQFTNYIKTRTFVDGIICTGDMVYIYYSDGMDFWDGVDGSENIMMCIGNHDVNGPSPFTSYGSGITQQMAYDRYFAPYIANWGVTYTSGKTYYYKDYSARNIRLICLDTCISGDGLTEQNTWLQTVLEGAKTNGYTVVIMEHFPVHHKTDIPCGFNMAYNPYDSGMDANHNIDMYQATVQNFIDAGGKFACFLCGHTHYDKVLYNTSYPDQICIAVASASYVQGYYSDQDRVVGTETMDAFNVVMIDTEQKTIKLVRIGASSDNYLRPRNYLTISYDDKSIITDC